MTRVILASALATAAAVAALPAQAQLIGPCPSIIMPPPCIVLDGKKLLDIAAKRSQDVQKVQQTVATIQQAKAATSGIMTQARSLTSFQFSAPSIDASMGPLYDRGVTSIRTAAKTASDRMFAGTGGVDANMKAYQVRDAMVRDANSESYAFGAIRGAELTKAVARQAELSKKVAASADLRQDWEVNSEIKTELFAAQARHAYLMTAFVRMQAANGGKNLKVETAGAPGSSALAFRQMPAVVGIDQSDDVRRLMDINARSQQLIGALGVVQMTAENEKALQGVIDDYDAAVVRKQQNFATLNAGASNWVAETKNRGAQQELVARILRQLDAMDASMEARRQMDVGQLGNDFALRNIDANTMLTNEVDPRQFIGNWTDPLKASNTKSMIDGLMDTKVKNGGIDGWVDGDDGTREQVEQYVYDYNDARLEEAWKKGYAEEARQRLAEGREIAANERDAAGGAFDQAAARAELEKLVAEANEIGRRVTGGADGGSKLRAAEELQRLKDMMANGTDLPVVEVDLGGTAVAGVDPSAVVGGVVDAASSTPVAQFPGSVGGRVQAGYVEP